MAPEIVMKTEFCGPPADVYASGVLLFAFFCGCFPYKGTNDKDLYNKIANSELALPDYIPPAPKYILKYMLKKNADDRPTSHDLIQDPWIMSGFANLNPSKSRTA
jgi:serine/threonine protein kinase